MKNNVTIRIGAAHWDARVRSNGSEVTEFDFSKMTRTQRRIWRVALVRAYRESREAVA